MLLGLHLKRFASLRLGGGGERVLRRRERSECRGLRVEVRWSEGSCIVPKSGESSSFLRAGDSGSRDRRNVPPNIQCE